MLNLILPHPIVMQCDAIRSDLQALDWTVRHEASKTRELLEDGLAQINYELQQVQQGFSQLEQAMRQGFAQTLEELAVIRMASAELLATARTPAHTAALEHYDTANDWYRRGLLPEALEEVDRAIVGVPGVSAGYKTDWRFHALRGLIYLGVGVHHDATVVSPQCGHQCFEYALRYLDPSDFERRSAFLTCCGIAKVLLRLESADDEAMHLFLCAIHSNERNVEARLEFARVAARRGHHAEGLTHLQAGCHYDFRAYSTAEHDPRLALYRDQLAPQKSAHIRELQHHLPSLLTRLLESAAVVEQHIVMLGETLRRRPKDDLMFRRHRASARRMPAFGLGLVLLSFGSCAFVVKSDLSSVAAADILALVLACPAIFLVGILTVVAGEGATAQAKLVRARQAALVRIEGQIVTAQSTTLERICVATSAAQAWIDAVSKLAILGEDNVQDRQRGAATCWQLHQLAHNRPLV